MEERNEQWHILTVDIGGSHVKATVLNMRGEMETEYERVDTPEPKSAENIIASILELAKKLTHFDRISVGFPGFVKNGVVITAPNLDEPTWKNVDLRAKLEELLGKPTQVVNDADLQGLGVASGKGLELVLTLGTGFGTALLLNGKLLPHLEISHHPVSKGRDYDEYIGQRGLDKVGDEKWNTRMEKVFQIMKTVFNYDQLYISGGNAKKLKFDLDPNMTIVNNKDGIKGGAKLWW